MTEQDKGQTSLDISRNVVSKFKEDFYAEMLSDFAEQMYEKFTEHFENWLLYDTELNLALRIDDLANQRVNKLLQGDEKSINNFVTGYGWNSEKVREAIFEQFKDDIITAGIKERDKKIKWLEESLYHR